MKQINIIKKWLNKNQIKDYSEEIKYTKCQINEKYYNKRNDISNMSNKLITYEQMYNK